MQIQGRRRLEPIRIPATRRWRLCKKPSLGRVTGGKPLRVWLFYWVPAFAGTTILGFLHSLVAANAEMMRLAGTMGGWIIFSLITTNTARMILDLAT